MAIMDKKDAVKKPRKGFNRQSNKITRSGDVFTLGEKRAFYIIINKFNEVDSLDKIDKDLYGNYTISLRLDSLDEHENLNGKKASEFASNLRKKYIKLSDRIIPEEEMDGEGMHEINVFVSTKITKRNGVVFLDCDINGKVANYFYNIGSHFTEYNLQSVLFLSSTYAQKMYENFCSWQKKGEWIVSIDELKNITQTMKKTYNTGMFLKRVVDASIAEINGKTELRVTYEIIKEGKSFTHIAFKIKKQEDLTAKDKGVTKLQAIAELPSSEQSRTIHTMLASFKNLKLSVKNTILSDNKIAEKFVMVYDQCMKAKNPTGYLMTCLEAYLD